LVTPPPPAASDRSGAFPDKSIDVQMDVTADDSSANRRTLEWVWGGGSGFVKRSLKLPQTGKAETILHSQGENYCAGGAN